MQLGHKVTILQKLVELNVWRVLCFDEGTGYPHSRHVLEYKTAGCVIVGSRNQDKYSKNIFLLYYLVWPLGNFEIVKQHRAFITVTKKIAAGGVL